MGSLERCKDLGSCTAFAREVLEKANWNFVFDSLTVGLPNTTNQQHPSFTLTIVMSIPKINTLMQHTPKIRFGCFDLFSGSDTIVASLPEASSMWLRMFEPQFICLRAPRF